jgi:hypothetical protein
VSTDGNPQDRDRLSGRVDYEARLVAEHADAPFPRPGRAIRIEDRNRLAADDLRDALMAHAENHRNIGHWQAFFVCGLDGLVPFNA